MQTATPTTTLQCRACQRSVPGAIYLSDASLCSRCHDRVCERCLAAADELDNCGLCAECYSGLAASRALPTFVCCTRCNMGAPAAVTRRARLRTAWVCYQCLAPDERAVLDTEFIGLDECAGVYCLACLDSAVESEGDALCAACASSDWD